MRPLKELYYKLGVELLDKNTLQPIEHIEYEEEKDFNVAKNIYNSWRTIKNRTAKYMTLVYEDGSEILMALYGYKKGE